MDIPFFPLVYYVFSKLFPWFPQDFLSAKIHILSQQFNKIAIWNKIKTLFQEDSILQYAYKNTKKWLQLLHFRNGLPCWPPQDVPQRGHKNHLKSTNNTVHILIEHILCFCLPLWLSDSLHDKVNNPNTVS